LNKANKRFAVLKEESEAGNGFDEETINDANAAAGDLIAKTYDHTKNTQLDLNRESLFKLCAI
jgi:hypothetical protein